MPRVVSKPPSPNSAPLRTLEVFCVLRQALVSKQPPRIMVCTPLKPFQLVTKYPMLERFCFPEKAGTVTGGEVHFTFVQTSENGEHMYGHCVRTINAEVLCIVSRFPWCRLFRDLMFRYRANGEDLSLIEALHKAPVPSSGHQFLLPPSFSSAAAPGKCASHKHTAVQAAGAKCACASPTAPSTDLRNPSFPGVDTNTVKLYRPPDAYNPFVDAHPALLLRWMNADTLMSTMASLLSERRVAIVGPDVGTVSAVILALLSLLRPFEWSHVLVPVVPHALLGVIAAPTPLLVGLLTSQLDEALAQGGVNNVILVQLRGTVRSTEEALRQRKEALSANPSFFVSFDRNEGFSKPSGHSTESKIELIQLEVNDTDDVSTPIPKLPWTSFPLCSLRLALTNARATLDSRSARKRGEGHSSASAAKTLEADRILLNAFMDYYVHLFGRSLTATAFNPVTFIEDNLYLHRRRMQSEIEEARQFFSAAMECILYLQFRDRYVPALTQAEDAAAGRRVTTLSGYLPEEGGFAEAVLLTHPDLYPEASLLAVQDLHAHEADHSVVKSTLVSLKAPFWSLRTLGRMCSYGILGTVGSPRHRNHVTNGGNAANSESLETITPPLSPAR
jgi:hypothetical protein